VNGEVLPLAITMMAGPQIMSAIILVTGESPVRTSLAYVSGVALAATAGVFAATLVAELLGDNLSLGGSSGPSTAAKVIQIALVGLLLVAALKAYLGRETAEPPRWLGTLQTASTWRVFGLGALLILLMPTDVVIMLTTGVNLESNDLPFTDAIPLIVATALIAALPLFLYLLFRRRAAAMMPKMRDWMSANSWLVNIFVYALFILLIVA
jgi:hypothetical protein